MFSSLFQARASFLINAATLIRGLTEDATEPGKRFDNEKKCHIHSDESLLQ